MRRNARYLVLYLTGWALAEWSLHKLTAPAQPDPDLYGTTSVQDPLTPHRFREFNEAGNYCHEPGCALGNEEHLATTPAAADGDD